MADPGKELTDKLLQHPRISQVWSGQVAGSSPAQRLRVGLESLESDDAYDLDECTITITSHNDITEAVEVRAVIDYMKSFQGRGIVKVMYIGCEVENSRVLSVARVKFRIVHNMRKSPDNSLSLPKPKDQINET